MADILGINAYHPDSSACIIRDGQLVAAAEEERFKRIKHWAGFPRQAIRYCLKEAGSGIGDIEYIALNRNPLANLARKFFFVLLKRPAFSLVKNRVTNVFKISGLRQALGREFSLPIKEIRAGIYHIEHHRAHLASSFFVSPFKEAVVVSLDGFGDFTSCMIAQGQDSQIKPLYAVTFPHSLGIFYTAFTQLLGFKNFGDEYKVMGLSAYGKPKYADEMRDVLALKPKGRFALNLGYFSFYQKGEGMLWDNAGPVMEEVFSQRLVLRFGAPRQYEEEISDYHCDLAASVQKAYEEAFFHILNHAYRLTGISNLCLAGGCALNSLANGKIFARTPFKEIYIQPAASDAGGALGVAYYLNHQILENPRNFVMKSAYWGPGYTPEEIENEIKARKTDLDKAGCKIEEIRDNRELCLGTAKHIAEGKIVGWFQGRMEWGARALGNRSILADPRRPEIKDVLNARIKRREWFRPFAPSILLENVGEYFEVTSPDPFMLKVYPVRKEKRGVIPAVTHVDGTARVETVSKEENPLYWQLIKEFTRLTGVPVLLNTSFNENEPIVCGPKEAIECFLRTKMDLLAIGNIIISKVN